MKSSDKPKRVFKKDDPFEKLWRETFQNDPTRSLSYVLGRDYIHEIGAYQLHRVGLMNGLGFRVPASKEGGQNLFRIMPRKKGGYLIETFHADQPEDPLVPCTMIIKNSALAETKNLKAKIDEMLAKG